MVLFVCGLLLALVALVCFVCSVSCRYSEDAGIFKIVSGISLILAVIGIVVPLITTVPTGHTGVVTTFGKVSNYTLDSGIHVKAPWQSIVDMDNRVQKNSVTMSCFSADIQEVNMNYTINYRISESDAMTIYSTIGKDYYNTVIVPTITESVKIATAQYSAEAIIANRSDLAITIEKDLTEKLSLYNIILISTSIENLDFTDEFTNAVEAKQVAQQNKLRAETEAEQTVIEAEAKANAEVAEAKGRADALLIEAEAQAEANRVIAESLTEEILDKMYYDTWNGVLPSTMVGSDSNVAVVIPTE